MDNSMPPNNSKIITPPKTINPLIIFSILVLIVLVGVGSYILGTQTKTNQKKQTKQIIPTLSNIKWNTFSDEKLGISFEYPVQWKQPSVTQLSTRTNIEFKDGQETPDNTTASKLTVSNGVSYNQTLGREVTLSEYIEQFIPKNRHLEEYERIENYNSPSLSGKIYTHTSRAGMGNWITDLYMAPNSQSTSITSMSFRYDSMRGPAEKPPAIDPILQHILSSFKVNYTFGNIKIINNTSPLFSFEYPVPQYCQGCYDGLGGAPEGYASAVIDNQARDYGKPEQEEWLIQYTFIKNGTKIPESDTTVINSDFFEQLAAINKGQTRSITDFTDHKEYQFIRLEDQVIDGIPARIYTSNFKNGVETEQTKYAVFTKDNYQYLLAVIYADPKNSTIFDLVTSSFRFSSRPDSTE